jgi:branched-chain amino acid transport system substrate-binding protein
MTRMKLALLTAAALLGASFTAARADITIATAGPMTGEYATFGDQMRHGAEMAVKDINAKGGVLGQKLVLEIGDDACDPKQAVAVANTLVTKKVVFVAGHYCSGSSIPASKVYQEEGIVQISPASTNPKFTDEGSPMTFRVCGRDDQQGAVAAAWIVKHHAKAKIAVLDDKSAYGAGLADVTLAGLQKAGANVVLHESITAGEKDYSAIVSRMKAAGVNFIYLGGYHTEAGLIVRQAHEQGLKAPLMSGDALVTQEFWGITGASGEGTLMTFSPDPRKNPHAAKVVAEFKAAKVEPEGYVLYTYAAVQTWAEAATRAKTTDAAKVSAVLHSSKFPTVLGVLSFDKKGDVTAPGYVVYRWSKGNYDYATGAVATH